MLGWEDWNVKQLVLNDRFVLFFSCWVICSIAMRKSWRGQVLIVPSECGWQNATLCDSLFILVVLVCVLILLYTALRKDGTISLIEFQRETQEFELKCVLCLVAIVICIFNSTYKKKTTKTKHFPQTLSNLKFIFIVYIRNLLCTYAIYCVHTQFIVYVCNLLCTYAICCVFMQFIVYVCNLLCTYTIYCVCMQFACRNIYRTAFWYEQLSYPLMFTLHYKVTLNFRV